MALLCGCPPDAQIPTIPTDECIERIGQIQKFLVQRTKNGAVVNEIDIAASNPNLLATWTALKAATDSTKVQTSPYIQEPVNEAGEAREYGGGNQTLGGIPITIGRNPSTFEAAFVDVKQKIIKELKKYECEKELSIFLLNEHGQIIGITDDPDTPAKFKGIPVRSFFVSDKRMGMYEEVDKNMVKWSFLPNWSDNLHIVNPSDFDALAAL